MHAEMIDMAPQEVYSSSCPICDVECAVSRQENWIEAREREPGNGSDSRSEEPQWNVGARLTYRALFVAYRSSEEAPRGAPAAFHC